MLSDPDLIKINLKKKKRKRDTNGESWLFGINSNDQCNCLSNVYSNTIFY